MKKRFALYLVFLLSSSMMFAAESPVKIEAVAESNSVRVQRYKDGSALYNPSVFLKITIQNNSGEDLKLYGLGLENYGPFWKTDNSDVYIIGPVVRGSIDEDPITVVKSKEKFSVPIAGISIDKKMAGQTVTFRVVYSLVDPSDYPAISQFWFDKSWKKHVKYVDVASEPITLEILPENSLQP